VAEPTENRFFLDADCREPDPLVDDQALFIDTTEGLVVIAGCAHAGVVNTIERISELTGRNKVLALVGGLHLERATRKELELSGNAIGRRDFQILAPCHCTGAGPQSYLRARFPSRVQDVGVGTGLVFGER
jgi:7,8-dihydropterin-6-yl-methyl-4-(beta-D-ribofuranosyl)aminobenzene 5'-phosphate synthase